MGWMLLFMLVILKIPLVGACWLIWYAVKDQPEPEEEPSGGEDRGPRRKPPPRPRWPRRGPAGGGAGCKPPPCPQEREIPLERPAPAYARRS